MIISNRYNERANVSLYQGDCTDFLRQIPLRKVRLVITSPPYNIGKSYETRKPLKDYLKEQARVIRLCVNRLAPGGSICWQVGHFVAGPNQVIPLDILLYPIFVKLGLKLRNRIIWHFEHGLHAKQRLSGRHEVILWFTKGDDYVFNLDSIRVPQKYPGKKSYKGPNGGSYSGHPLGKNPGDVWDIPNVKSRHPEKTIHPCQFPVELVERLVLALSDPGDLVLDPYIGVATTAIAAVRHGRRAAGAETSALYHTVGMERLKQMELGTLKTRPMNRPIYQPSPNSTLTTRVS